MSPNQTKTPTHTNMDAKMNAVLSVIRPKTSKIVATANCRIKPVSEVVAAL
jgi:hypothetical protein